MKEKDIDALHLRAATPDDRDLLFGWTNDPEVRRSAFRTDTISYILSLKG